MFNVVKKKYVGQECDCCGKFFENKTMVHFSTDPSPYDPGAGVSMTLCKGCATNLCSNLMKVKM